MNVPLGYHQFENGLACDLCGGVGENATTLAHRSGCAIARLTRQNIGTPTLQPLDWVVVFHRGADGKVSNLDLGFVVAVNSDEQTVRVSIERHYSFGTILINDITDDEIELFKRVTERIDVPFRNVWFVCHDSDRTDSIPF